MIDKWSKLAETSKGECMLLLWIPVTVTVLLGGRLKNLSVKVSIYVSNMRNVALNVHYEIWAGC